MHPFGIHHRNSNFDPEQNFDPLVFSLYSSERPKSALRPAGTLNKNLLATFRYVKSVRIHPVSRFPGIASLSCLVLPTELWSNPTCLSPARSVSGAEPSDRGAGGRQK